MLHSTFIGSQKMLYVKSGAPQGYSILGLILFLFNAISI